MQLYTVAILIFVLGSVQSTKWLNNYPGFNDPLAWISELPCSLDEVLFPDIYPGLLPLPQQVDIGGLVLPKEGALLLEKYATIELYDVYKPGRSCENGKRHKAYIKPPAPLKWYDPKSWNLLNEVKNNKALLDMQRVPCNNESVVITNNGPLSLDLENVPLLRLGQLNVAGSVLSKDYVQSLLSTDLGQIIFHNSDNVKVEYYRKGVCGCHRDFPQFLEPICHNVLRECEKPLCLSPILPSENCCPICGSVLRFSVKQCSDLNYQKVRQLVINEIEKQNKQDALDFSVHYVNSINWGEYLQVVVVDRDVYSEKSVKFLHELNATNDLVKFLAIDKHLISLHYSGKPYNPNITFTSILMIIFCLAFVSIVSLFIFAHYMPDHPYLNYLPRRWRNVLLRSPFVFMPFDNSGLGQRAGANDPGMPDNIIMGYEAGRERIRERSFDNPMFNEANSHITTQTSRMEEVQDLAVSSEPDLKEQENCSLTAIKLVDVLEQDKESGTAAKDTGKREEQELTEIKLESSNGSSDEENETGE